MLAQRLRAVGQAGVIVTNAEIEQEYRRKNEKVQVEWVKLTADKYAKEVAPSPEDLQSYFKANAAHYQIHEKKSLTILAANPGAIEAALTPADADLQKLYDRNKESFRVPERVKAQHILLKNSGKTPAEDAKIKAKAEDLLKQIRAGANFAELAKKNSEDEASVKDAKNPGELPNWIVRAGQNLPADSNYMQTVKEFEDVVFALKPGQVSDVVKTQYGYHIIKALAHEDAHLRTFEEAKSDLAAQWKKQRANDVMQNIEDKAQAELQKDPSHPEKVAAEYNMQMMSFPGYEPGAAVPLVGTLPDFDSAVSGLNVGEVSPIVALPADRVALAVVTGISPARPATFEEVKADVVKAVTDARTASALQNHSQELIAAAKSSGDLAKAAKAAGLEVKTSDEFAREGSIEGLGSASYLQDAFSRPDGTVLGPITVPDGTVIAEVAKHVPADMSKLAEQRQSILDDVRNRKARDLDALFGESILDGLMKQGKVKLHKGTIQRLIANYSQQS
jgi:peptidyl-prolyl cis-trans isomerase D